MPSFIKNIDKVKTENPKILRKFEIRNRIVDKNYKQVLTKMF